MAGLKTNGWKAKDDFINHCFDRFGSMNKNDYEVELMHLILQNGYEDASDNSLSRLLQIPISKIKRLRYEVDLHYPKTDDDYKDDFYNILERSTFKRDGHFIQFSIPNKALREHLSEMLENEGSYYDSSFNTNIVKITANDLLLILSKFEKEEELKKEIIKSIHSQDKNISDGFRQKCETFLRSAFPQLLGIVSSQLLAMLTKN